MRLQDVRRCASVARWLVALALLVPAGLWEAELSTPARAQECPQPSSAGCPLDIGRPAAAALLEPSEAHAWIVTVNAQGDLIVRLSGLPADYDLHVFGPDGALLGESLNEGIQDDVVVVPGAPLGAYYVYVNSARGAVSVAPYTLAATVAPRSSAAPPVTSSSPSFPAGRPPHEIPAGPVLLTDDFESTVSGSLARSSNISGVTGGYVDGEYRLGILEARPEIAAASNVDGVLRVRVGAAAYGDASIAVDARIVGQAVGRQIFLACRDQGDFASGYRLRVEPQISRYQIYRRAGVNSEIVALADWHALPAIRTGNQVNRVELICSGTSITGTVNGTPVASVQDATYAEGFMWISFGAPVAPAEARFDNLVVHQR